MSDRALAAARLPERSFFRSLRERRHRIKEAPTGEQREASADLAGGRVAPALDAYQQAGRLQVADTRDAARADLLARYAADRAADPGHGQLMTC